MRAPPAWVKDSHCRGRVVVVMRGDGDGGMRVWSVDDSVSSLLLLSWLLLRRRDVCARPASSASRARVRLIC